MDETPAVEDLMKSDVDPKTGTPLAQALRLRICAYLILILASVGGELALG
jgi:hypothetical protein